MRRQVEEEIRVLHRSGQPRSEDDMSDLSFRDRDDGAAQERRRVSGESCRDFFHRRGQKVSKRVVVELSDFAKFTDSTQFCAFSVPCVSTGLLSIGLLNFTQQQVILDYPCL